MQEIEINKNINNNLEIENKQNKFLESTLFKTLNTGLNMGLRYLLPDLIENQIIDIKDTIINEGLQNGFKKAIQHSIDLGKSAIGIFTGKFENVSQVQNAIKAGGIIDTFSNIVDTSVNSIMEKGKLSNNIGNVIKQGKNVILNSVENNIKKEFDSQNNTFELVNKYIDNWKDYYNERNFEGMEREYYKLKTSLKELIPIENTLKEARTIENLHILIKNNGQNFDLSEEQKRLAKIL